MLAAAALAGAAACLGGCNWEGDPTTANRPGKPADVSVVDGKGNTSILTRGVFAAGVPIDAKGPRFFLLPAKDASIVFDRVSKSSIYRVTTLGSVIGKDFTREETAEIHGIMAAIRPLWQCPNLEMRQFARVNILLEGRFLAASVLGVAYSGPEGLIAIADTAHTRWLGFRAVVAHEIGHRLLQYSDPRTCTNYNNAYDNPLVKAFMQRVGWKDSQTLETGGLFSRGTSEPMDAYSRKSPLEDMATSFAWYLGNRAELRRRSAPRAEFWDSLFAAMKMAPPNELYDPVRFPAKDATPTQDPPPVRTEPLPQPPTGPILPPKGEPPAPTTPDTPPVYTPPRDKTIFTIGNPADVLWRVEVKHGDKTTIISMNWNGGIVLEHK